MPRPLPEVERLLHVLTDVRIMQAQVDAIELILVDRIESKEVIDAERRKQIDALLMKVASRLKTKAASLYEGLLALP